jgi:large subunit ribosomal protein L15
MVNRRRKKKNKLRGHRTHGHGDTKNRRGAGSRGGRGRAGSHKHKYSKYYMDFGGKKAMKAKPKKNDAVNVGELDGLINEWMKNELVQKENDYYVIDGRILKIAKILGKGTPKNKYLLKNVRVTNSARKKLEASGSKIEEVEKAGEVK